MLGVGVELVRTESTVTQPCLPSVKLAKHAFAQYVVVTSVNPCAGRRITSLQWVNLFVYRLSVRNTRFTVTSQGSNTTDFCRMVRLSKCTKQNAWGGSRIFKQVRRHRICWCGEVRTRFGPGILLHKFRNISLHSKVCRCDTLLLRAPKLQEAVTDVEFPRINFIPYFALAAIC
jgi:hypothetical protein